MKRRKFIYQSSIGFVGLLPVVDRLKILKTGLPSSQGPFLATGIKIGEVTTTSAIVWARLTKDLERVGKPAPVPQVLYLDESNGEWHAVAYFKEKYKEDRPDREVKVIYPEGHDVTMLEGAAAGAPGSLRVHYRPKGGVKWETTAWKEVNNGTDYATQFVLNALAPDTEYELKVEGRGVKGGAATTALSGRLETALPADRKKDLGFVVTTCHEYNHQDIPQEGFKIYKHMRALDPAFMVHTGDVVYHDQVAKDLSLAYWNWQRMFALSTCTEFYRQVPCYFMKDDHDTWMNDCYPGSADRFMGRFTFDEGVRVFNQQVPIGPSPYRTIRWGKDLQVWLVEGREYRSRNDIPDGPDKTIWGKVQMEWFKESFRQSDATFRVLISPTPIVGPDRPQKKDNHANSGFAHEGRLIREFLASQRDVFIVCGDRHWQYASQDSQTGLMEFSCGPASDEHAGGWPKDDKLPEHHYLNIVGGFLGVDIKQEGDRCRIFFTHYGVDGEKLYSENFINSQV
ncbi:MAG TPA: alkaline phosphatase D family protein [Puia sp.]|jgi:alkaline phosphatase D